MDTKMNFISYGNFIPFTKRGRIIHRISLGKMRGNPELLTILLKQAYPRIIRTFVKHVFTVTKANIYSKFCRKEFALRVLQ
jgi:hypothetical protein